MKKIATLLLSLTVASVGLTSCKDPHEGEHCTVYQRHTHVTTTGTGKNKHTRTYTTNDCIHWEKDDHS